MDASVDIARDRVFAGWILGGSCRIMSQAPGYPRPIPSEKPTAVGRRQWVCIQPVSRSVKHRARVRKVVAFVQNEFHARGKF